MTLPTVRQQTANQSHTSSRAAAIRDMAKEEPNKAVTVKIGEKEYFVVNMTGSNLTDIPNAATVKKLAEIVIKAHDEDFELIDSQGAHYTNKQLVPHTDKGIDQQALHEASEGLSRVKTANDDKIQLTKPQTAAFIAMSRSTEVEYESSDIDDHARTPDLPKELQTALTTLAKEREPVNGKKYKVALNTGFNNYLDGLAQENRAGLPPDKVDTFNTQFVRLQSENKNPIDKLFDFNRLTSESRTAQHAWNAMLKEAGVTQRTGLSLLDKGIEIVRADSHLKESQNTEQLQSIKITPTITNSKFGREGKAEIIDQLKILKKNLADLVSND